MASSLFNPPITLTTPSHSLMLSEATPADIPAFCSIFYTAHESNPFLKAIYGTAPRDVNIAADIARWKIDWPRPGRRFYKAIDAATGETVAVAKWVFPHTPTLTPAAAAKLGMPEGVNVALAGAFYGEIFKRRDKWIKWEDMYQMNVLAILPEYQRLGIRQAMLATVLKQADEVGRKVFIEATPEGASLYQKFGWVECDDRLRFDLVQFDAGEGVLETTLFLMRVQGGRGCEE